MSMAKTKGAKAQGVALIGFSAVLHRPAGALKGAAWTFVSLPKEASDGLASRGQVSVEGTLAGVPFVATLDPDGRGGHWLRVDRKLSESAGVAVGGVVKFEITPLPPEREPEPTVPPDVREALAGASKEARAAWSAITPVARRDWIFWIVSSKQEATRARRIVTACDMLGKGKRRPCCFDRSGMYSKSLCGPEEE